MLEKVDLTLKLPKKVYKSEYPKLKSRLYEVQQTCRAMGIPVILVFEGWDGAGKSDVLNRLSRCLDPTGFKFHAIQVPQPHETLMPWLWRFWLKIPRYGELVVFDHSWYRRILTERVENLVSPEKWRKAYRDIISFERTLANDGYVIIKLFLHISKAKQRKRFQKLEKHPLKSWHVQTEDWEHHLKYNQYLEAIEDMLERTDTEWGPWTIVEASNRRWTRVKCFKTIIQTLERAVQEQAFISPVPTAELITAETNASDMEPSLPHNGGNDESP